tara:strand:+ start:2792 stop:4285 length:1494 start_codon:yes stop_codon:yes gene_type:complete
VIFFRIVDNKLFSAGEVDRLGFEESEGYRIPDEYLQNQEFMVMRTCHGLGDWGIVSSLPKLIKQKYPNSKVYLPTPKLLESLFGSMKHNWGAFENPFLNVEHIFKNNPYVDGFKDYMIGEVFHDHYRVYDRDKKDIPIVKQILKFWQFEPNEYKDCSPNLHFSDEEIEKGESIIKKYVGDNEFGGLLITGRYESQDGRYDEETNKEILSYFLDKNDIPYFYYTYKPKDEFPFEFNGCLDMRNMDVRTQLYIRTKAKFNIGNHCGVLDCVAGSSKVYQVQRVFPLNQNKVDNEIYLNKENYKYLIDDDDFKVDLIKGLPDKFTSKTTTSLKWKVDFIDYFRDDKYKDMKILEIGSSLGHSSRTLSFLFKKVIAVDNLSERHIKSNRLNYDRDNIEFVTMDVYNQPWNFESVDVVFIDCVHDYVHIKSDIENSLKFGKGTIIAFDDYGLFPEVKKAIDEYIKNGILKLETYLGMPLGTKFPKTLYIELKDWEGLVCQVM